jgi:hypothetical protein
MSEINHKRGEIWQYPSCFGDHDWVLFNDPFSNTEFQPYMRCSSCGMIQRWYGANYNGNMQLHQQGYNLRPFKLFFDVPDSKKGYAG